MTTYFQDNHILDDQDAFRYQLLQGACCVSNGHRAGRWTYRSRHFTHWAHLLNTPIKFHKIGKILKFYFIKSALRKVFGSQVAHHSHKRLGTSLLIFLISVTSMGGGDPGKTTTGRRRRVWNALPCHVLVQITREAVGWFETWFGCTCGLIILSIALERRGQLASSWALFLPIAMAWAIFLMQTEWHGWAWDSFSSWACKLSCHAKAKFWDRNDSQEWLIDYRVFWNYGASLYPALAADGCYQLVASDNISKSSWLQFQLPCVTSTVTLTLREDENTTGTGDWNCSLVLVGSTVEVSGSFIFSLWDTKSIGIYPHIGGIA